MDKKKELQEIDKLFDELWPLNRSIMGQGYRESMQILRKHIPLEIEKFKTGEKVLNWSIPKEWVIREAYIEDSEGNRIVDFKKNNLYVVGYSTAVNKIMDLEELKPNLYTLSHLPEAIPYVTSYYQEKWGFCMSQNQYDQLKPDKYRVYIDSEFIDGTLEVGDTILKGESSKQVLLTSYLCHPSMANNELSGPIVQAMLYKRIASWPKRNLTYRFVLNPETIGSIAFLSRHGQELKEKMYSGLVLTCLGGGGKLSYKCSRQTNSSINSLIRNLKSMNGLEIDIRPFIPINGSDERQYCSAGFNLPMGQIARLVYGQYPEYHNSLDNKELMKIEILQRSIDEIEQILWILDQDGYYINNYPYGEIKLGDYDLYPKTNSYSDRFSSGNNQLDNRRFLDSVLTILNYSDGTYRLSEMADKIWMSTDKFLPALQVLKEKGLIEGPYFDKKEGII